MSKNNRLTLKLHDITPNQLPMARLVEYLSVLSGLYGYVENVHFESIEEGSTLLNSYTSNSSVHYDVIKRTKEQISNNSPLHQKLVKLITTDRTIAEIISSEGIVIGTIRPELTSEIITIRKRSSVQGRLYKIGGKDEIIPVKLEGANKETLNCEATSNLAVKLSHYLFKYIRVTGNSEWIKKDGIWKLKKLTIEDFIELQDINLGQALQKISKDAGNNWDEIDDAYEVLEKLRSIN